MDTYPFIRQVKSPITPEQLSPLDERCQVVQFSSTLTEGDHIRLAGFLRTYPQVPLRVYGYYDSPVANLEFLRHYSFLTGFQFDLWSLETIEGIEFLPPTLEYLGFGQTKSKNFSLQFLTRFRKLKELHLEGHSKDFEAVGELGSLERLTLRSITLPDLATLTNLRNLWWLAIKLGGTNNLRLLPQVGQLKYLELWMVRGLADIEVIGEVETLQFLFLQALKNVTALPSFKKLRVLKRLALETMNGIRDLSPILEAPALEDLAVVDAKHLKPEDFRLLVEHPTLKRAHVGLGSTRKNEQVEEMLGLPKVLKYKTQYDYM